MTTHLESNADIPIIDISPLAGDNDSAVVRLQPHRSETFKLSSDPFFVEKVRDIVGLPRPTGSPNGRAGRPISHPPRVKRSRARASGHAPSTLCRAFETVGFAYISGHGISESVIDAAFAQSRAFFESPDDTKRSLAIERPAHRPPARRHIPRSGGNPKPSWISVRSRQPRPRVAAAVGFAYISNLSSAQSFFDTKRSLAINDAHRGYIPLRESQLVDSGLGRSSRPNLSESFFVLYDANPDGTAARRLPRGAQPVAGVAAAIRTCGADLPVRCRECLSLPLVRLRPGARPRGRRI